VSRAEELKLQNRFDRLSSDLQTAESDGLLDDVAARGVYLSRQMLKVIRELEAEVDRYHDERDDVVGQLLKLRAERDAALARIRELQAVETARSAQRLTRLRAVARMAEQTVASMRHFARLDGNTCDCTVCCLRAALAQLEEGDV